MSGTIVNVFFGLELVYFLKANLFVKGLYEGSESAFRVQGD